MLVGQGVRFQGKKVMLRLLKKFNVRIEVVTLYQVYSLRTMSKVA